jgi:predicted TIM-barrel fold metal-dependent hydrolase
MRNSSELAREFLSRGRSETCLVIDMHGHLGAFSGIYLPKAQAHRMLDTMDHCGVSAIVCSSHSALVDQERGNQEMAQVVKEHPGRFYGYRVVNPNYPEAARREVDRFRQDPGFVGFKFHPDQHSYRLSGDGYAPALECAQEHGLIVLTHTWGHSEYDSPRMIPPLAEKYSHVTFIMGHSGYGEWEPALAAARDYENVYLDLCAAYRVNGIIGRMVEEVGSGKILFGTDLPWFDPHWAIGSVCFSRISDEDRCRILHRNAERLLAPFLISGPSGQPR